ncbi:hypothetical protein [Arthrobacter sp. NyZ413]|uniref:hypothetical protein n=1 Tax=Arthrobacter sp. NyZ413 TaxID=3144669 RepID=UPI003BF91AE5
MASQRMVAPAALAARPSTRHFATEIVEVARACAAVSSFERLFVVLAEWRATAEAVAAGYTPDDQLEWPDDSETVSHPRAGE